MHTVQGGTKIPGPVVLNLKKVKTIKKTEKNKKNLTRYVIEGNPRLYRLIG
jgi:hypothetical protein